LRPSGKSGNIRLTAESEGLQKTEITITTK